MGGGRGRQASASGPASALSGGTGLWLVSQRTLGQRPAVSCLGQRLCRSRVCGHLGLLSPALVVPGRVCCVHVDLCVFVCGVIYARVLETLWMVLTATCNFAFPLFLTTPFKPFECTATFAINRFYHYVVFFTAGDCGLLLPPHCLLVVCTGYTLFVRVYCVL